MLHHQIPESLRYDQFNGQRAEKQTCGSHNSRGFVVLHFDCFFLAVILAA